MRYITFAKFGSGQVMNYLSSDVEKVHMVSQLSCLIMVIGPSLVLLNFHIKGSLVCVESGHPCLLD